MRKGNAGKLFSKPSEERDTPGFQRIRTVRIRTGPVVTHDSRDDPYGSCQEDGRPSTRDSVSVTD